MDKLEELTVKRWTFLQLLDDNCDHVDSFHDKLCDHANLAESVMEGTSKDRVSHFILRLVAAHSDFSAKSDFVRLEKRLFVYRLQETSTSSVRKALREVVRHIDSILENVQDDTYQVLRESLVTILKRNMLSSDQEDCEFHAPFQLVPSMVGKRLVELSNGQAVIKCSNANIFLECVFENMLQKAVHNMTKTPLAYGADEDDIRLKILISRIQKQVSPASNCIGRSQRRIFAEEVDALSRHFPLCFTHVHSQLKAHHRLGHHARIAYSLFLKELGMPMDEAIKFWSHHYSKHKHGGEKSCTHSWQDDHKKFEYSIKHMYGNAGGKKSYSAHSCLSIANRSTSINEELVCPFADNDIEDLGRILAKQPNCDNDITGQVLSKVKILSDDRKVCSSYLSLKSGTTDVQPMITKPSQYFGLSLQMSMNISCRH